MKLFTILTALLLAGCISTPDIVTFNNEKVGTYSASAGCGTLKLEQDCSQLTGATKNIEINNIKLRVSGSTDGIIVFLMSMPKFRPDEVALSSGAKEVERLFLEKNIKILETKVMHGNGITAGVHYRLNGDGYSLLKELAVD